VEQIVKQAHEMGIKTLALTDINTITGIYDFKRECEKYNIKPVIGIEVRKEGRLLYIAIAREFSGVGEVNKMLTAYNFGEKDLSNRAPEFKEVFVIYPLSNMPEILKEYEFIGVREEEANLLIRPEKKSTLVKWWCFVPLLFGQKKSITCTAF
jgi:DNA polymerase-3 subunit alpha